VCLDLEITKASSSTYAGSSTFELLGSSGRAYLSINPW